MINVIHINKQDRVHLLIFVSMKQASFIIALTRKQKQTKRECENGLPYCLGFTKPCWFLARMWKQFTELQLFLKYNLESLPQEQWKTIEYRIFGFDFLKN